MSIAVKPVADVAKKWSDVTPGRSSYYQAGTANAGDTWQRNASAAKAAFVAGVTAGNIGNMYAGGIKQAGAAKFNRKVADVGVARFGPGVQAAAADYQAGVAPMLETIAGITLSARGTRGSPQNYQRVTEVGTALNKKRAALRAAGA